MVVVVGGGGGGEITLLKVRVGEYSFCCVSDILAEASRPCRRLRVTKSRALPSVQSPSRLLPTDSPLPLRFLHHTAS